MQGMPAEGSAKAVQTWGCPALCGTSRPAPASAQDPLPQEAWGPQRPGRGGLLGAGCLSACLQDCAWELVGSPGHREVGVRPHRPRVCRLAEPRGVETHVQVIWLHVGVEGPRPGCCACTWVCMSFQQHLLKTPSAPFSAPLSENRPCAHMGVSLAPRSAPSRAPPCPGRWWPGRCPDPFSFGAHWARVPQPPCISVGSCSLGPPLFDLVCPAARGQGAEVHRRSPGKASARGAGAVSTPSSASGLSASLCSRPVFHGRPAAD